jgi:hypothetical protein
VTATWLIKKRGEENERREEGEKSVTNEALEI